MKKLLFIAVAVLALTSCRKEEIIIVEVPAVAEASVSSSLTSKSNTQLVQAQFNVTGGISANYFKKEYDLIKYENIVLYGEKLTRTTVYFTGVDAHSGDGLDGLIVTYDQEIRGDVKNVLTITRVNVDEIGNNNFQNIKSVVYTNIQESSVAITTGADGLRKLSIHGSALAIQYPGSLAGYPTTEENIHLTITLPTLAYSGS